jgi:4-diphosphocytidyl-2-C-methyl-D-erythritol kinase
MMTITARAPAKINLGLAILGKLPNGYHEVKTIYYQVDLADTQIFNELPEGKIELSSNINSIPLNHKNLVYQAVELVRAKTKTSKGVKIFIKKNIPSNAGLGGGSSDAATTLKALNKLWSLKLSPEELIKLAQKLGADVAYSLMGGAQLEIQGGDQAGKFVNLGKLPECLIVICFPNIRLKSRTAYLKVEYNQIAKNDLSSLIAAIKQKNLLLISSALHNDFEIWTLKKYPAIKKIKEMMVKKGALGSLMSGKGSSVYGIFNDLKKAKITEQALKKEFKKTFLVKPV